MNGVSKKIPLNINVSRGTREKLQEEENICPGLHAVFTI